MSYGRRGREDFSEHVEGAYMLTRCRSAAANAWAIAALPAVARRSGGNPAIRRTIPRKPDSSCHHQPQARVLVTRFAGFRERSSEERVRRHWFGDAAAASVGIADDFPGRHR